MNKQEREARFVAKYDELRELGLNKKQIAEELEMSVGTITRFVEAFGKPKPYTVLEFLAPKVKAYILEHGGSIRNALRQMGEGVQQANRIRTHLLSQGWDYNRFIYKNQQLGVYVGGEVPEEELSKPWNERRVRVRCSQCGHEHLILISQFSSGRASQCSACPNIRRNHRLYLWVEKQQYFDSLRQVHRELLKGSIDYQTLRYDLLEDGYFKSKDGSVTISIAASPADDEVAKSARKRASRRPKVFQAADLRSHLEKQLERVFDPN